MISLDTQTLIDSTTAASAVVVRQLKKPVVIGGMIAVLATSAAYGSSEEQRDRPPHEEHTTAGVSPTPPVSTAIGELRRLSGLTWEQLAELFGVRRRSLHFWASGSAMTPRHEEHLHRLLAVIRKIDRGSAAANRAALLTADADGNLPIDLLKHAEYERVVALLGSTGSHRRSPPMVSAEVRAARRPRPPEELVDALQEGGPPPSGRLLAASPLKIPRSK